MSRPTPQCGRAKLGAAFERGLCQETFLRVEDLANEWIIETWLPLLDEGHLQTAVVRSLRKDRDWCPCKQLADVNWVP